jgi:hypothetical protein
VGVGYLDAAEKEYSHPHLIQQSSIEILKSSKRFVFSLLDISFSFFATVYSCSEEFCPFNICDQHEF